MLNASDEQRIRTVIAEVLDELDAYLVDLRIRTDKVQVFVDRDPHITIEDCARINRSLVRRLDEAFSFTSRYALEVSSPGLDQPLRVLRQFRKNIGRSVDVVLYSGEKKRGVLLYVDEDKVILEETIREKKQNIVRQTELPFVNIKSTLVVINF
ncbi:MAG: ribosome maturation factor [Chitinophagales bacterium]|nr:ribosome maturation factor [Chitinophagales bacterium]MDW8393152.1 ribosome maturation factor [Chitinophagales bacterium]